jgi:omega-6 fatty acid desaturase (delta-12 desaturase)
MFLSTSLFKDRRGLAFHGMALAYAVFGYAFGMAGILSTSLAIKLPAALLLAHSMTIAAYLLHECAHNTIFRTNAANARLGRFLSWLVGSIYGSYEDMRHKHLRHHVENGDIVWFDYDQWFARHPRTLGLTRFLEWFYIPAHDLLMHGVMVFTSFVIPQRRSQRVRNVFFIVLRVALFAALAWLAPAAAVLYALAYMAMMTVLRFMDALQHDYGQTFTLFDSQRGPYRGDKAYELAHTFSNPLSTRHAWVNLLVLNFGFHNAHHARPTTPWYDLPAAHRALFRDTEGNVIPLWGQLKSFHRFRVSRVVGGADTSMAGAGDFLAAARRGDASGGNAASFLTSF